MTGTDFQHVVRRHADGQTVTAVVSGEWDSLSDSTLVEDLRRLLDEGYQNVIIDAQALSFCDSTALGALVGLHQATVARGGWLRVAAPPSAVRRPMMLTGLDQLLNITDAESEADPAAAAGKDTTAGQDATAPGPPPSEP